MARITMQKIGLTVSSDAAAATLEALQGLGSFEVMATETDESEVSTLSTELSQEYKDVAGQVADLDFVIRYLEPHKPLATTLREELLGEKIESDQDTVLAATKGKHADVVKQCTELRSRKVC